MSEMVMLNRKKNKPFPILKVVTYTLLIIYAIWLFFPLYTIVAASFTSSEEFTAGLSFTWFPVPNFDSYVALFSQDEYMLEFGVPGMLLGFFNTLWITLIPLFASLFISGLSAYVFSKFHFKGRKALFTASVITMTFPLGAFTVITYIFYSWLGWYDSPLPFLIPSIFGSVGTMFFLRMYFDGIPNGLIESAKIDGAGFWGIFFKIMLPLAKPAFIAQFIFGFVGGYNNYMGALLYLKDAKQFVTIQLILGDVKSFFPGLSNQNIWCAAAVVGMLPLIILYIILQKYFIEGIAVGGIKE